MSHVVQLYSSTEVLKYCMLCPACLLPWYYCL
jgi:hypothetical protein